jgi:catechol 2,3-dioxygenase-like lactoylglutathione lyase family enzyme
MIEFKRLDHVFLCVPEGAKDRAREFYGQVLGLTQILGNHPRGAIWFEIADIQLHINEENGGNFSMRHPAFEVTNLPAAKTYLKARGIEISQSSHIEGRDRFFFRDPFGNRIELLEYLS